MSFRKMMDQEKQRLSSPGSVDQPTEEEIAAMEEAAMVSLSESDRLDPRYIEARDLKAEGRGVKEICRLVGIGTDTYYRWFPNPSRAEMEQLQLRRADEMRELRAQGWSDAAIGRHLKCSRQHVAKMIGKREKSAAPPKSRVTIKWVTTIEKAASVEKQARLAGAALDDGRSVSIPNMLEMLAEGLLIVTHNPKHRRVER